MLKLLKFEYRRLFLRTSLYICLGVVALPVMYMFYMIASVHFDDNSGIGYSMLSILQQSIGIANLTTLVVIFTSIFGCEDKARGTVKTIYSLGYSRVKLFFAKFLASATAAAMMYGVVLLFGLICGILFGDESASNSSIDSFRALQDNNEPDIVVYIIQQFLIIMAVHAFYYMIAELVQKTGVSIVLGIFGPGIISTAYGFITLILCAIFDGHDELVERFGEMYSTFLLYWLPTTLSSIAGVFGSFNSIDYTISIIVNIGYVIVFGGLAMLITCKKQIK